MQPVLLQVDQGLGLGTGSQLFNRHTASATRILRLNEDTPEYGIAPLTLVGHVRYGACIGELPAYEAFVLGGPHSVRPAALPGRCVPALRSSQGCTRHHISCAPVACYATVSWAPLPAG